MVGTFSSVRPCRAALLSVLAGLLVSSAGARAGTITAKFDGVSPGQGISYKLNGGNTQSTTAGVFDWTYVSGTNLNNSTTFNTFCIDLTHFISTGSKYKYSVDSPIGSDTQAIQGGLTSGQSTLLSELFGKFYSSVVDNKTGAAFQIAVWDIVYDGGVPNGNSPFQVTSTGAAETLALQWLNNLDPNKTANLLVLDSDPPKDHQNQITLAPVVPEPSSFVLAGIGVVGLMGLTWRRRARLA
jgi:hypothetical protein